MNHPKQRIRWVLLLLLPLAGLVVWMQRPGAATLPRAAAPSAAAPSPTRPVAISTKKNLVPSVLRVPGDPGKEPDAEAAALVEAHKEIDRAHLRQLHAGIFAYRKKYGTYPEYLTQLVPEFVSADTLVSPHKKEGSIDPADYDHPDPGLAKPSYGYEFSNLEFRDGRTFAEIKEVQRAEWGDAVPLLRCFAYGQVINMAYGGEIYETALNWEWDPNTLNVVEKLGWGPGLTEGETVRVQVKGPDGQPLASAQVWADGRNYSFDLPNRPYPTDAQGYATIPLGVDLDRTELVLRAEAPGLASITQRFPNGSAPDSPSLEVSPSRAIGGMALDDSGQPLPDAWVYLNTKSEADASAARVTAVKTDGAGAWKAEVHPDDLPHLSAVVGLTGSMTGKSAPSQPLDSAAALAGQARVTPPVSGQVRP